MIKQLFINLVMSFVILVIFLPLILVGSPIYYVMIFIKKGNLKREKKKITEKSLNREDK